jgi:trehalose 6-phosphate phosphatase
MHRRNFVPKCRSRKSDGHELYEEDSMQKIRSNVLRTEVKRTEVKREVKRTEVKGTEVKSRLTPFLQTVSQARESALLLDYDGTLAPFQARRDQAAPYPGVALILQQIIRSGRTRVVVISGRDASDILPLLNIHPRPEVWGIHGLQRLKTDGSLEMPDLDERTLNGLSDADRWLGYQQLRHTAEFKAGSIAVHWRGLSESGAEDLRARVSLGWRPIAKSSGLDLLEFDGGVEIRAHGADKGDAVRTFLSEISPHAPAAYLGDDNTDESAFRAMHGHGISVLVRPRWRQTAAQFWLKPPEELLDFLGLWLKTCVEPNDFDSGAAAAAVNQR